jgi:hypothetical protein
MCYDFSKIGTIIVETNKDSATKIGNFLYCTLWLIYNLFYTAHSNNVFYT